MRTQAYHERGTLHAWDIDGWEVKPNDRFGYKIIAVIHGVTKDGKPMIWSAYRGYTGQTDEEIASNGDIILYEIAKLLFPTIDAVVPEYRE
jgi:hypothetical protein